MTKNSVSVWFQELMLENMGGKSSLHWMVGVSVYTDLPSYGLGLVPFQSQLYKAFNTTFKLMVFLLEKKKIKD